MLAVEGNIFPRKLHTPPPPPTKSETWVDVNLTSSWYVRISWLKKTLIQFNILKNSQVNISRYEFRICYVKNSKIVAIPDNTVHRPECTE
jgi:hypothetical protein